MVNPFEWFYVQLEDAVFFLRNLSWNEAVAFFAPAFFIDFPRYVLVDLVTLAKELLRPARREETEFARRLRGADPPLVSVVIAGFNEGRTIEACIRSLTENTYPNKQIVIVNDGSTDEMDSVCQRLVKEYPIVYLRHETRTSKPSSINHGASVARGEFIMVGDADTTFDRDAIYRALLPFADPRVGVVSTNLRIRNANASWVTRMQAVQYLIGISVGRRFMAALDLLKVASGAFGVYRASVFRSVGGFDIGPGDDTDTTVKARKAGFRVAFAPKAVCLTTAPVTEAQFFRQRRRWNRSSVRRIRKHKDLFRFPFYNPMTTLALLDTVFFNIVTLLLRVPYYGLVVLWHPNLILRIALCTWMLYVAFAFVQFSVVFILSERKRQDFWLYPWLPLYPLFTKYHALIRVYAYVDEFFFYSSYRDPYTPDYVQREQHRRLREEAPSLLLPKV